MKSGVEPDDVRILPCALSGLISKKARKVNRFVQLSFKGVEISTALFLTV